MATKEKGVKYPPFEPNMEVARHAIWKIARTIAIPKNVKPVNSDGTPWTHKDKDGNEVASGHKQFSNMAGLLLAPPEGHTRRPGTYWAQDDSFVSDFARKMSDFRDEPWRALMWALNTKERAGSGGGGGGTSKKSTIEGSALDILAKFSVSSTLQETPTTKTPKGGKGK